jgi:hypothetical protein
MTRLELLTVLVARARANGFEFRRWYTSRLGLPWISAEAAVRLLSEQRRYYALLFSHEFAFAYWKAGEEITFTVPSQTYQRRLPNGELITVTRKPFQRRSARRTAWLYHLREMAAAEEPLRYLRRYLNILDELQDEFADDEARTDTAEPLAAAAVKRTIPGPRPKPIARALPTDIPAFLRRPYP